MFKGNENPSERELVVDSDWLSAAGMAAMLFYSVFLAVTECRNIVRGHTSPVSYATVLLAVFMTYIAVVASNDKLLRAGTAALAIGCAVSAFAYYFHASPSVQQLAGLNDHICSVFAGIVMFVWAIQWFRAVVHLRENQNQSE